MEPITGEYVRMFRRLRELLNHVCYIRYTPVQHVTTYDEQGSASHDIIKTLAYTFCFVCDYIDMRSESINTNYSQACILGGDPG